MEGLEAVVLLGVAVLAGVLLAPRTRIAAPLLLLVMGLLFGFIPAAREIEVPPETVLLIFLPVMLFWESLTTSLRSVRRDLRGIVLLSTLLVVATAFAVAGTATLFGVPWNIALILGAAVAPPDATAVAALGRMLPRRNFMALKAESLTNDGTALVIYAVAVGVTVGGSYTPLSITGLVLLSYVGGALSGVIVAVLLFLLLQRTQDALAINVSLLVTPFAAFLMAELIGASGVFAVVVAGLLAAYTSTRTTTASSRRQTEAAWPLGSYILNGSLFVLIGLQVQTVNHEIDGRDLGRLLLATVAVWVVVMVVRFVFQTISVAVIRLLDRRPAQRERRMTYRARVVSSIAGFRGAVSLAIALSVPLTLDDGSPLEGRDDIVFITAGVIILSLLVQGPVLPAVVRWAKLPVDNQDEERELALRTITAAASEALEELIKSGTISSDTYSALAPEYAAKQAAVSQERNGSEASAAAASIQEINDTRLAVLRRKREELNRLRREGAIDDSVAREIQSRLDVEEQRLVGVEPLD